MADSLFLITGGGTGAKVAEALVHLCAAGLGPATVHLLVVDADTTNGNLQRAVETAKAYREMQRWPWSVETKTGGRFAKALGRGETHRLTLFRSELIVHTFTRPLDTAISGGIASLAEHDGTRAVLDLLYDADEQQAKANDGFRARPNLGCLLLADHFETHLRSEAGAFVDALDLATANGAIVPIVVSASIFGGTGASLLPIARGVIEQALQHKTGGSDPYPRLGQLRWGATMVLPHYQPTHRLSSVDPDRYLLDTSNALQFYGITQRERLNTGKPALYDAIYAIGSDAPGRNRVKPFYGDKAQANPAYVEETICALAALEFAEAPSANSAVRVFNPERERIGWADLPLGGGERLVEHMAYLLHLGAFFLRPSDPVHPGLSKGLAGLLSGTSSEDLEQFAWFKHVLDPWAEAVSISYKSTPKGRRGDAIQSPNTLGPQAADALRPHAVEYFGRLQMWAASALRDGENGVLHLLTHLPSDDYTALQGEMAKMDAADVNAATPDGQAFEPEHDNALARLLRTALAAEVNAHERTRGGIVGGNEFKLVEPGDGRIGLRVTPQQVRDALRHENREAVADEYTRTAVTV